MQIIRRLVTLTMMLVLAVGIAVPPSTAQQLASPPFLVEASWLAQLGRDPSVVVVDMRAPEAYAEGHIPGAVSLPVQQLAQPNTDEDALGPWQQRAMELLGGVGISRDNTVVAYDENGNLFSARLRWVLKYLGHERVVVLDGGLSAWTAIGQPISTEATTRPATTYVGRPDESRLATWRYVLDRIGDPNVQILDVRPLEGYTGDNRGTAARGGHIPTALNHDWNNNVQATAPRTFKSLAELQAALDAVGLDRNKEIIVYCTSGIQSSNGLFVLDMLGYPRVRLYSGSWNEWGNRPDLPIATGPEPGAPPARTSS